MNKKPTIEDATNEWLNIGKYPSEGPKSILARMQNEYVSSLEETIAEAMSLLDNSRPICFKTSSRWEDWHHRLLKLQNKTSL